MLGNQNFTITPFKRKQVHLHLSTIHPEFFYKLIPCRFFFCYFFCNFYGNSLRPPIFSVTPMRSSGSRVDWKIFFVIFTKLIPRKNFLYCKNFGVDGTFVFGLGLRDPKPWCKQYGSLLLGSDWENEGNRETERERERGKEREKERGKERERSR